MSVRTPYTIKGETGDWELVMGLEVHAQVVRLEDPAGLWKWSHSTPPGCRVDVVR